MPVEDLPIHSKVRHDKAPAGCYNRPKNPIDRIAAETFTGQFYFPEPAICRQVGRKFNGTWIPLDECMGCQSDKDEDFIAKARIDIDKDLAKSMKADQRI